MTGMSTRREARSARKMGHLEGLVQLPPENLAQMLQRTEVCSAGLSPSSPRVPIGCLPNGRAPGQNVSAKLIGVRKLAEWFKPMVELYDSPMTALSKKGWMTFGSF